MYSYTIHCILEVHPHMEITILTHANTHICTTCLHTCTYAHTHTHTGMYTHLTHECHWKTEAGMLYEDTGE